MNALPFLATALPVLVAAGLARQEHRIRVARRELEAYLRWMQTDVWAAAGA